MPQAQEQQQQVNISVNDLILAQLRDLKENQRELKTELKDTRKELNARIDRLEMRLDKQEEKIDRLANKIDSSSNHGQISNITTIGIALAVIYSILK
ncbi:MAG: hypothetical protein IKO05_09355 [Selenomonadaceae bacterium]|nr:hypothetical protein [Selenomonadaceae bacterium]